MLKKNLSVIIPCFNEGKNLFTLVENIVDNIKNINFELEVILINNGSTDNSLEILQNLTSNHERIKIINIKKNIGYGHGILTGLAEAKYDYICWTHADLQCDFKDCIIGFKKIFEETNKNEKKFILKGNRVKRKLIDRVFTKLMSIFIKLICKVSLEDINAQPKIFTRDLFLKFKNPPNDFLIDFYLMNLSQINKYEILKLDVDFKDRKFGIAKGGGSIFGKIRLSIKTAYYIIKYTYGNNNSSR